MKLLGWLVTALVVVSIWSAFATWRWSTASSRCDTRIAEQRGKDAEAAIGAQSAALGEATRIFGEELSRARGEGTVAAGNTHTRETIIQRVPVTGQCVMPDGLPSLAPAVKEARDAAKD